MQGREQEGDSANRHLDPQGTHVPMTTTCRGKAITQRTVKPAWWQRSVLRWPFLLRRGTRLAAVPDGRAVRALNVR